MKMSHKVHQNAPFPAQMLSIFHKTAPQTPLLLYRGHPLLLDVSLQLLQFSCNPQRSVYNCGKQHAVETYLHLIHGVSELLELVSGRERLQANVGQLHVLLM